MRPIPTPCLFYIANAQFGVRFPRTDKYRITLDEPHLHSSLRSLQALEWAQPQTIMRAMLNMHGNPIIKCSPSGDDDREGGVIEFTNRAITIAKHHFDQGMIRRPIRFVNHTNGDLWLECGALRVILGNLELARV